MVCRYKGDVVPAFAREPAILKAVVLVLAVASYPAMAESLAVEVGQDIYHYGDILDLFITVEEITAPFATMYIIYNGTSGSPINIPITQLDTSFPAMVPFDRTVFTPGTYEISVVYVDMTATAMFDLVDVGTVVIPNWIKNIAFFWITDAISDLDYLDTLARLVDEDMLTSSSNSDPFIPSWLTYPTAWWLGGLISDKEYIVIIQYLIDDGVITGL